ncbi:MAG: hypothetical protein R3A80_06675 [Bdellovibrionota bacterium]
MSIHRSGVRKAVTLVCKYKLDLPDLTIQENEKVELIHDLGSMYVVLNQAGKEAVVPKDAFAETTD